MKIKQKTILIGVAIFIVGLLIGKWVFSSSEGHDHTQVDQESSGNTVYTCSMHPQIRQNEPGICPICEMDLTPLSDQINTEDPAILQMTPAAVKLAQIETIIVGSESLSSADKIIRLEGTVQVDERQVSSQTAHVGGRIDKINIGFTGSYVRKGQVVASIYSPELFSTGQELLTAYKNRETVPGLYPAVREKLKNWKLNDVQIQQILDSGKAPETIDIIAEESGYITSRRVSLGDYIEVGGIFYTLTNTSRIWAVFNAFESDLAFIRPGSKVTFQTPSLPGKTLLATISSIDPILDSGTRSVQIRALIGSEGGLVKPGMIIRGELAVKEKPNQTQSVIIPQSSVLWTGKRSVVYVQDPEQEIPTFNYREVELGDRVGNHYTILSGIEFGDRIVVKGAFAVDASAQLSNRLSMMNKNVTVASPNAPTQVQSFKDQMTDSLSKKLLQLADQYLLLKDQLVNSNPNGAKAEAEKIIIQIEEMNVSNLSEEAMSTWNIQVSAINEHVQKLIDSSDIEAQRKQFQFISDALITMMKSFGIYEGSLFVQHCPMAFDNAGANWLSDEKAIRNPYFGDRMMKCGSVIEEIHP